MYAVVVLGLVFPHQAKSMKWPIFCRMGRKTLTQLVSGIKLYGLLRGHSSGEKQQQQQPFYGPWSGTTRVSQYQKKNSPTHHFDHHPIFISFFHLPQSIASSLFKLRAWQYFCTTSFHVLWSTSWSGALHLIFHTFLQPISVFFSQHMPIPSQPVLL